MARLIVCEKQGTWAAALRRHLAGTGIRLQETRSVQQCREELADSPRSLVAVEATPASVPRVYRLLVDVAQRFPQARAVVLAPPDLEPLELALREAGAVHAVFAPLQLAGLARLAKRHLAASAERHRSVREQVAARLPWGS